MRRASTKGREAADLDSYFRSNKPWGPLHVEVGDRVGFTRYTLRTMLGNGMSRLWILMGTVVEERPPFHVLIRWDDEGELQLVHRSALAFRGANRRWCD